MKGRIKSNSRLSFSKTNEISRAAAFLLIHSISLLLVLILLTANSAAAPRSILDGTTPAGFAPGAPAGSYGLSAVENINLFNGNLNFTLPLLQIGGRGGAQSTMVLPIESRWTYWYFFQFESGAYMNPIPMYNFDTQAGFVRPGYGPGTLMLRGEDILITPCSWAGGAYTRERRQNRYRLTFVTPEGTNLELRDTVYGGAPITYGFGSDPDLGGGSPVPCDLEDLPSRGTTFVTADGTAATFISDAEIEVSYGSGVVGPSHHSGLFGYLKMRDGTQYRIDNGLVSWMRDRNGNKITYTYTNNRVNLIKDSLGRETTIEYEVNDSAPYGLCDRITFKGTDGETRVIRVSHGALSENLAIGFSIQSKNELFPHPNPDSVNEGLTADFDPTIVSSVWLPDGRRYSFDYNSYAELVRVALPTGGAYEYDWEGLSTDGCNTLFQEGEIIRRVEERRVKNDSTLEQKSTYTYDGLSCSQSSNTEVTVDHFDGSTMTSRQKHFFYGNPSPPPNRADLYSESAWSQGKEYQTDSYAADATTLLRSVSQTWRQKASVSWWTGSGLTQANAPANDPRMVETLTTLADSDQVSKVTSIDPADGSGQTVGFDQFNNRTDVWEYDFGDEEPGAFLRRTHTDYLTTNSVNSKNYTDDDVHILNLPSQTWVSSDSGESDIVSRTRFEYDNYSSASEHPQHDPLISRSSVTGYDSTNYGTNFTYRGNVTAVTSYTNADAETGGVTAYSFFDVLGNVVKTRDARGKETSITYTDNFGDPDDALNSGADSTTAGEIDTLLSGSKTFAFPTSTTNPLSWTAYVQYDYFTGKPVNTQDVNGVKSKMLYEDPLDRQTHTVVGLTSASQAQTKIEYDDDSDRQVIVKSDLNTYDDKLLKTVSLYDGLGRTKETRTYEADGNYAAVQTEFDALGRAYKVSNPFRPGDTTYWTESKFDALGRIKEVETLDDDAKIFTNYHGNRTLVKDQAGKQRISKVNALGLLTNVWEIKGSDGDTEAVSFEIDPETTLNLNGLKTSYTYNALGNLTHVDQGTQDRDFAYDSLSRLTSAENPESGEILYEYDSNGNLTEKTDARGIVTTYTYDELNRVTAKVYATPSPTPSNYRNTPSVTYTYDNLTNSKGHLTKVESSISTTEYTEFDILGRVLKSKQTTDGTTYGNGSTDSHMTYTYNLAGMLIEQQYPSGRKVQNVLDNDGQLEMVKSRKNANSGYWAYANNISYNAAGVDKSMQLGNGTWESTVFNNRLQPTQIALGVVKDGYDRLKLNYSYGDWDGSSIVASKNNGNIVQQVITVPNSPGESDAFTATQKYYYDSLNRIDDSVETISGETWQQDFSYDRYGNRSFVEANTDFNGFLKQCSGSMCSDLKKKMNPTIGSANRLSTSDDYAFDSSGNTTADPDDRQFIYDGENKQVKVLDDEDETIGEYWYDGDGRRVKKYSPYVDAENPGEITVFVYDAFGKQIAEYSVNIETTNAQVAYVTNDHLGSPRINTDKNGGVTARHDYHPFGEEIATAARTGHAEYSGDKVRKQFTGYERDQETDLDFAQARYFNYGHGRFSSPDPLAASANSIRPQSWNRYVYVYNNPYRFTDPTGMTAGDFLDDEGKRIGTDGKSDGRLYYVAEKKDRETIRKHKGAYTSAVASALELPSFDVRQEIGVDAVARSNAPTAADPTGGDHEEGGSVVATTAGQKAIPAASGDTSGGTARREIVPTNPANPAQAAAIGLTVTSPQLETTYHVHPQKESSTTAGPPKPPPGTTVFGGSSTTTTHSWDQGPSPKDISNYQSSRLGYNIVVGARDKKVYFYNGNGRIGTPMSLKGFVSVR